MIECDYLVIGSGIAGLTLALEAAQHGEVVVVTKQHTQESATRYAQGGIAAVLDPQDTFEAHVTDTLTAGRGISRPDVVELVVREGPACIERLMSIGTRFSGADGKTSEQVSDLDLTREGGHSARRVVHAGDITGREVARSLAAAARQHSRIRLLQDHMAIDLVDERRVSGGQQRVSGAFVLDENSGEVAVVCARATVLATGGAGKVYLYTSNPDIATGDGVAMAYRAGAQIANLEFFQFHPTCLFHPQAKSFLISEALRGEGGVLRHGDGTPFMQRYHSLRDLAPRDVVARAIDHELKRTGADSVFLDMSACAPDFLRERFPNIHQECLRYGIDMTQAPIPVVPAAHYMCGGVVVDEHGQTTVPGLFAIGETACTGLHGANRLASNSLLEGLVFGRRAAAAIRHCPPLPSNRGEPRWDVGQAAPSDEAVIVAHLWEELRRFMWNYVGIVRSDRRLERAARRIALLQQEIREYYWQHLITVDLLELRNIAAVADLIVQCAQFRKESRGLHYNIDHEARREDLVGDTVLSRGQSPTLVTR